MCVHSLVLSDLVSVFKYKEEEKKSPPKHGKPKEDTIVNLQASRMPFVTEIALYELIILFNNERRRKQRVLSVAFVDIRLTFVLA